MQIQSIFSTYCKFLKLVFVGHDEWVINVFFDWEVFAVFGFGDFDFDGFGVGGEGFEVGEFDFADDDGFAEFDGEGGFVWVESTAVVGSKDKKFIFQN